MDIFDILTMIGGLSLFLFGMNVMGSALERRAGDSLCSLLGKLTTGKIAGLLTGIGVTAVIQSSSATTVMVVGFVNSGLMSLGQAINVIMGANVGTTVTAWILSLGGIDGDAIWLQLLKPSSFTPILALIGVIFYVFCKGSKKKDTGMILLGFATLMFGMETMSDAVAGLSEVPAFRDLFIAFENPLLGVLAGALLTAVIQSSSASVGILQALAVTGQITLGAAVPIIMGQNIGTCITAILSSVGANRNAKRAALVHLSFNVVGTLVWLIVFCLVKLIFAPVLFEMTASHVSIAVSHSVFNVLCTLLLLPMSKLLEKLVYLFIPETKEKETISELDERLLTTPAVALERSHSYTMDMAKTAFATVKDAMKMLYSYDASVAETVRAKEKKSDHYEDVIGGYLVKLSSCQLNVADSAEAAKLLRTIGDLERISDYGVYILRSAEELREKEMSFSAPAMEELSVLTAAVEESLDLAWKAFFENDADAAIREDALEEVIDRLKKRMRSHHIRRLQEGGCSIEAGFVWSDLITALERISDHCTNITSPVLESAESISFHESMRLVKTDSESFRKLYADYAEKYAMRSMSEQTT